MPGRGRLRTVGDGDRERITVSGARNSDIGEIAVALHRQDGAGRERNGTADGAGLAVDSGNCERAAVGVVIAGENAGLLAVLEAVSVWPVSTL